MKIFSGFIIQTIENISRGKMAKLKDILIKIRDALYFIEDQLLIFVPEKYREKVRNIINALIIITGAVIGVIALL